MRSKDPRRKLYLKNQYLLLFTDIETFDELQEHIVSKDGIINTIDHPDVVKTATSNTGKYYIYRAIENKRDQASLTKAILNQLKFFLDESQDHDRELFVAFRKIIIEEIINELFPNHDKPNNILDLRHFNNLKSYQEALYVVHYDPVQAYDDVENDRRKKQHSTIDEQLVALKTFAPELLKRLEKETQQNKRSVLKLILNYNATDAQRKFDIIHHIEKKADISSIQRVLSRLSWFK